MISWSNLCYDISALSKLPNGGGSEVEFKFCGKNYVIIHYRDRVSLSYYPDDYAISGKYVEKSYLSMDELGEANDFGFRLRDGWNNITNFVCHPDFEEFTLDEILDAYRKAWDKRNKK